MLRLECYADKERSQLVRTIVAETWEQLQKEWDIPDDADVTIFADFLADGAVDENVVYVVAVENGVESYIADCAT
jgi:hypothetical protein